MIRLAISPAQFRHAAPIFFQIGFVAICGSAAAADLPYEKPPAVAPFVPPPAFSWTGFYAGVNGGFALDHYAFKYDHFAPGPFVPNGSGGITSDGLVIGGQVGYNYQLSGWSGSSMPYLDHVVIGVEADSDWAHVTGSTNLPLAGRTLNIGTDFENFGTARLRLGYAFDRLLVYFTGGFGYATINNHFSVGGVSVSQTTTRTGVFPRVGVVGIGAEYAITDHVSAKAEYLYDFNGARWDQSDNPGIGPLNFGTRAMYHMVRFGVNYKFDSFGGAPVESKY